MILTRSRHHLSPTFVLQFKIEPFKHPLKMDPTYGGNASLQDGLPADNLF